MIRSNRQYRILGIIQNLNFVFRGMARCARVIDRFDGGGHLGGISDNIVFTCGEV